MRVIAGSARRLLLKTIDGLDTRPTTDRIKETLFNMLQNDVPGSSFLDLFSGSGAIGIEALSRGAKSAVFVEKNPKAVECIRENLRTTKLEEKAMVMSCDVNAALTRLEGKDRIFDIVFMDPPYNMGLELEALKYLSQSSIINEDSIIIAEASLDTKYEDMESLGFEIVRIKEYKTNKHVFFKKNSQISTV